MKNKKQTININLLLYLIGRMVSDTGTSIQMMIMPLYIIDAGGSAAAIGLFSFASLVPALLIYPFAGVLGDRLNRKSIMVVTDFISGGVILSLGVISYLDKLSLPVLISGMAMISLLNGLFDPATRGMLPSLVPQNELTQANSKVATLRGLSVLLGPVLGAVLYARFGITILFIINGVSFLLSGMSEMLIQYKHDKKNSADGIPGVITELTQGFRFIQASSIIRGLCSFLLVIYTLIQPMFAVAIPLFYKTQLNYSDAQYGYLQSVSILGMLLGSALVGLAYGKEDKLLKPLRFGCSMLIFNMLMLSLLAAPKILLLLGNGSYFYFILLALVFCMFSAAIMFINIPIQSFIQKETPNEYLSRIFSIVGMITRGGMPFGALIYGSILNKVATHWTVLAAALMLIVISAAFLSALTKWEN